MADFRGVDEHERKSEEESEQEAHQALGCNLLLL